MARKNKSSVYDDDLPGLDISSLIDVCFLLLIYFIVTSTIQASEQDINMNLPTSGVPSGDTKIEPMLIKVDRSGVIFIGAGNSREQLDSNPEDRRVPILDSRVKMYKTAAIASGSQPVVQMAIDGDAEQQRVLDCLNVLAKQDIKSVTFTDLID